MDWEEKQSLKNYESALQRSKNSGLTKKCPTCKNYYYCTCQTNLNEF